MPETELLPLAEYVSRLELNGTIARSGCRPAIIQPGLARKPGPFSHPPQPAPRLEDTRHEMLELVQRISELVDTAELSGEACDFDEARRLLNTRLVRMIEKLVQSITLSQKETP
jgi:hypothetical protein